MPFHLLKEDFLNAVNDLHALGWANKIRQNIEETLPGDFNDFERIFSLVNRKAA